MPLRNDAKTWKKAEPLANRYSTESTKGELSNEYQHDRVQMVFKNLCIRVLWTKVYSALEGLRYMCCIEVQVMSYKSPTQIS